jgi:Na+/H+ antiporter NhaD/arsenite permease-like protein
MLLSIALAPLFAGHWWENNRNKLIVSLVLGIPTAVYLLVVGLKVDLYHSLVLDYVPFIILLGALFTVTGGIHIKGDIAAKPLTNTIFLAIGALLASFMGTTGAAMLLIRPVISTIQQRKYKVHTILFFIAIVANCGGLLTPLGDPPLFLLYLRGVEFSWFFQLLPEWALANVLLLTIYFVWDSIVYKKEPVSNIIRDEIKQQPIRIVGTLNFVFLAGIVASVACLAEYKFLQSAVMVVMAVLSLIFTKKDIRLLNKFSWAPIVEVAFLFFGIFITMTPALLFLSQNAALFNFSEAWQFYYATGALSSFLDNAPTAISFYELAVGTFGGGDCAGIPAVIMQAVALGAVFFGAMTYIGNGPNFMIKAIAEENKITMPSFFGYMLKFSLIVLLPVYIIVQLVFL